jgi:simple sugar transport system ATP-binding protein
MSEPVLEARGIVKRFGVVEALRGVDFEARPGEVVALIGDNGAGKSTLVRVLVGDLQPSEGEILLAGRPVQLSHRGRGHAQALGIEIVYQDLALAPHLEPAENFFLNRELLWWGRLGRWLGVLDREAMRQEMGRALADLGVSLPEEACRAGELSGGQQQGVAVARAAHWASKLLFLDEPTAALGATQKKGVLDLVRRLRNRGLGIVYISHDIPEVLGIADRIHVLHRGRTAAVFPAPDVDAATLLRAMAGAS